MEKILTAYKKLRELRNSGVKMKDISALNGVTPSILSSLYRTIIPAYISYIEEGIDREQALDKSLSQVNNISRRKFFELIHSLESTLDGFESPQRSAVIEREQFFEDLRKEAIRHIGNTFNYSGFYLGYSRSSYKEGLKIEPMLVLPPDKGAAMYRVACMNALNKIYWGNGLFTDHQISYLFFNEHIKSQIGLKIVYMQLPMFDQPKMLKGIYIAHDYSRNPIARRVVYIKQEDISLEEFKKLSTLVKGKKDLTEQEQAYFKYTSEPGDYIHSLMSIVSPEANVSELEYEKRILNISTE